jgi:hypothetical protein
MKPNPAILVGTLFSGENEYDRCLNALKEQSFTNWQHTILSHLPNKAAHDRLYRQFMDHAREFDLFVKYDADMVFAGPDSLGQIADLFYQRWPIDHVEFGVRDFFSDRVILGLHAFSRRCRWKQTDEKLFVDADPLAPTPKQIIWDFPAPIADHSPDPSPFQAFHFGFHRAVKAGQAGSHSFDWFQFKFQWQLLKSVWNHFHFTRDRRLGLAVMGAETLFKGKLQARHYDYTDPFLRTYFRQFEDMDPSELFETLEKDWHDPPYAKRIAIKQMRRNPFGFFRFIIRHSMNKIRHKRYY